jgi:hypothetical protein
LVQFTINLIRDHDLDFQLDVQEDSDPTSQPSYDEGIVSGDETDMCALRDSIARGMSNIYTQHSFI